jgi:hypothetical protein
MAGATSSMRAGWAFAGVVASVAPPPLEQAPTNSASAMVTVAVAIDLRHASAVRPE